MSRLFYMFVGVILGGGAIYGALMYHLLRTNDGWEMVPKTSATFTDAYVDMRNFTLADWTQHRDLVAALINAKKESLLGDSPQNQVEQSVGRMLDSIRR